MAEHALPDPGGVAVATSRIAAQAQARGEHVHVVSLSPDGPPGARTESVRDGVTYHVVGRLPREEEATMALTDHAHDIAVEHGLDLLHGIYAVRAGYVATLAASWAGAASVVSLRGNDVDRGLYRPGDLPFLSHAVQRADVVTGVSRELCMKASGAFGRPVDYVPNSVDSSLFRPEARDNSLVAALGLGKDAVIGFMGELRDKKGMRFLLPAFADVCLRRPARLLLIGGVRSECRPAFEAFQREAPDAASRVHVIPYGRDPKRLCRLLALCDLMVYPSLFEGMPNALLETMAAERPSLATSVGGHLDLIEHGVTGALLPLAQLGHLPHAIEELLDLPSEQLAAMARAARAFVRAHHSEAGESAAYAEIYERARAITRERSGGERSPGGAPRAGDPTSPIEQ